MPQESYRPRGTCLLRTCHGTKPQSKTATQKKAAESRRTYSRWGAEAVGLGWHWALAPKLAGLAVDLDHSSVSNFVSDCLVW